MCCTVTVLLAWRQTKACFHSPTLFATMLPPFNAIEGEYEGACMYIYVCVCERETREKK